jgi:hypothetical protein
MRVRVNLRPDFQQLFHPLARRHVFLIIKILYAVILNGVKDLTISDRSRNQIGVCKPSIVRSLDLLGITAHRDSQLTTRHALTSCHLVIILQACYGFQFNR